MRVLISFSGGMDSATMVGLAVQQKYDIALIGFNYGSRHNNYEISAAQEIARYYNLNFSVIDFSPVTKQFVSSLLKTGSDLPEGHYSDPSMSQTVVPGRNLIFISILAGYAWSNGFDQVWLGMHGGDRLIYPDCRPEFFQAMRASVEYGTDGKVTLLAPFLFDNKSTILRKGFDLGVPYRMTRTCYKDQPVACGKCGSCQERLEAFANHGIPDPLLYESRDLVVK